jgi:hypothetical protein
LPLPLNSLFRKLCSFRVRIFVSEELYLTAEVAENSEN